MKRALVTFATGSHQALLEVALPSFEAFADTHGYDLLQPRVESSRPVSWWKVPTLKAVLNAGYDEALWIDADVVVMDGTQDLDVPVEAWQALVQHHTGDGDVPNCGVWLVRHPMIPVLDEVWAQTQFIDFGWWEQAALMSLMGFAGRPAQLVQPSGLHERTHWLEHGWNYHLWDTPAPEHIRFAHASMHKDRLAVMRSWANGHMPGALADCSHRYPIDGCLCDPSLVAA